LINSSDFNVNSSSLIKEVSDPKVRTEAPRTLLEAILMVPIFSPFFLIGNE
jgi:hypothetical protein